jgi:hypothetical protein
LIDAPKLGTVLLFLGVGRGNGVGGRGGCSHGLGGDRGTAGGGRGRGSRGAAGAVFSAGVAQSSRAGTAGGGREQRRGVSDGTKFIEARSMIRGNRN